MYTQCPNCQTPQPITINQLRDNRGLSYCGHCNHYFNALQRLSKHRPIPPRTANTEASAPVSAAEEPLPWEMKPTVKQRPQWLLGVIAASLLLLGQGIYFEGYPLIQNRHARPVMRKLCQVLHCRLPAYQNAEEMMVLQSSLDRLPDRNYILAAVIVNRAWFTQPAPNITLSLLNFNSQAIGRRTFQPHEYAPTAATDIAPDTALALRLTLAAPQTPIGGFHIEINY